MKLLSSELQKLLSASSRCILENLLMHDRQFYKRIEARSNCQTSCLNQVVHIFCLIRTPSQYICLVVLLQEDEQLRDLVGKYGTQK